MWIRIESLNREIELSIRFSCNIYPQLVSDIKDNVSLAYNKLSQLISQNNQLDHRFLFAKAYLAKKLNRHQEAIDTCHYILNSDDKHVGALILIGIAYMQTSRLKEGNYFYEKAINLCSKDEELWHIYGFCLLKGYREEEAIKALKKSISFGCQDPEAFHWLGNAYLRTGKRDLAIKTLIKGFSNKHEKTTRTFHYLFDSIKGILDPYPHKNYYDSLAERTLKIIEKKNFTIFGDSHIAIFRDIANLEVIQLGHPTAFNLASCDATSEGISQIRYKLRTLDPRSNAIILNFGEIDTRAHIYKQASNNKLSLKESINVVITRYMVVIDELIKQGYLTIVCGPFASGCGIPSYGTISDRNIICTLLNNELEKEMYERGMPFFSLNDLLIDHESLHTDINFFGEIDENHINLDQTTKTLYISELYKSILGWKKSQYNYNFVSTYERSELSKDKLYFSKKSYKDIYYNKISKEGLMAMGLSTLFIVDLKDGYRIDEINLEVYAKTQNKRNAKLQLAFYSPDPREYHEEYIEIENDVISTRHIKGTNSTWVRFVTISSDDNEAFKINNIYIYGNNLSCQRTLN